MANTAQTLPQLDGNVFLTDGGIETTLIFHEGFDLPYFASFTLLENEHGTTALRNYYRAYLDIAIETQSGFVLETPTWRANRDWADKLGYGTAALRGLNHRSVAFVEELRQEYRGYELPIIVSGNIGPRGDGYVAEDLMTPGEAADYHHEQIATFVDAGVDLVSAITITYAEEAVGIVRAAGSLGVPVVIAFTTETGGHLPSGQALRDAIESVDAATDGGPAYYMINCAHPDHFSDALEDGESWVQRIRGLRANASRCSHAELDEAEDLDDGNPQEFGELYRQLHRRFPSLSVFGGCCGTDHRHVASFRILN